MGTLENLESDSLNAELRARIAYLEAGLDAIIRSTSATGECLPECASVRNAACDDCDCGLMSAYLPGAFAAEVVSGKADLDGALGLAPDIGFFRASIRTSKS